MRNFRLSASKFEYGNVVKFLIELGQLGSFYRLITVQEEGRLDRRNPMQVMLVTS
jgi:hypothetical protein